MTRTTGKQVAVRETHRRYAIELKRCIVEETFAPGASVSIVARRHDVNANMVFAWRQKYHRGELGKGKAKISSASPEFIPVGMVVSPAPTRTPLALPAPARKKSSDHHIRSAPAPESGRRTGMIEITLRGGIKVRVDDGINEVALRRVLVVVKDVA
jgi:transposase